MSGTATSFSSPFESGDWGRWTNLERCQWLRAFQHGLTSNEEQIKKQFKLDKKKMKRLADAIKLLEAKLLEELAITEKAITYGEAMVELGMDAVLKSGCEIPISFPAFRTPKKIDHKGN